MSAKIVNYVSAMKYVEDPDYLVVKFVMEKMEDDNDVKTNHCEKYVVAKSKVEIMNKMVRQVNYLFKE